MPTDSGPPAARPQRGGRTPAAPHVRDRFAPYDGGAPYPEDAVEQWLTAPVETWGRAELCDLLAGFVAPRHRRAAVRRDHGGQRPSHRVRVRRRLELFQAHAFEFVSAETDIDHRLPSRSMPGPTAKSSG